MGNNNLKEAGGTNAGSTATTPRHMPTTTPRKKKKVRTFDDDDWMEAAYSASNDMHTPTRGGSRIRNKSTVSPPQGAQLRRSSSDRGFVPNNDVRRRGDDSSEEERGRSRIRGPLQRNGSSYYNYTAPQSARTARVVEEIPQRERASTIEDVREETVTPRKKQYSSSSIRDRNFNGSVSMGSTPRSSKSPRLAQAGSGVSKLWSQSVQHLIKTPRKHNAGEEGPETNSTSSEDSSSSVPIKKSALVSGKNLPSPRASKPPTSSSAGSLRGTPRSRESPNTPRRKNPEDSTPTTNSPSSSKITPSPSSSTERLRTPRGFSRERSKENEIRSKEEVPSLEKKNEDKVERKEESKKGGGGKKDNINNKGTPRSSARMEEKRDKKKKRSEDEAEGKKKKKKDKEDTDMSSSEPIISEDKDKEKDKDKDKEKKKKTKKEKDDKMEEDEEHVKVPRRGTVLFYEMMSTGAANMNK